MSSLKKAVLKSFNDGNYTATIQISGSPKSYLEDVAVARNLPVTEMTAGRKVAIVFFNDFNAREALVIAVYS